MGIAVRVASPKLVMEEAPDSYKDVNQVCGAHEIASGFVQNLPEFTPRSAVGCAFAKVVDPPHLVIFF